MPELPEVETIRANLADRLEGRTVTSCRVLDARWCAPLAPARLSRAVTARRVERLWRRGKYLVWTLAGEVHLLMHLRMTGALLYDPLPAPAHTRVLIALDDGHEVAFVDPRRFGTGQLAFGEQELERFFASRLGPEPFDAAFSPERLFELTRGRRAPIKAFLLDQRRVAGVGNIYADEALFRARIHPLRPAGRLSRSQLEGLHAAVLEALAGGIDARGASIDDFRDPDGAQGTFQDRFLVHRRAGEPCPRCGGAIVKLVAAGRGTYVCERCQPRPRQRRRPATSVP